MRSHTNPKISNYGSNEMTKVLADKSVLRTRPISLVSEDNLATNKQLSLSFSKYIRFTNKCYKGVDPTLDPNAYLQS